MQFVTHVCVTKQLAIPRHFGIQQFGLPHTTSWPPLARAGSGGKHVLQCVAVCCNVLQCVTVCCSVLQCAATCCSVVYDVMLSSCVHCLWRQWRCTCGAVCGRVLQHVAVCGSVWQCGAVCGSVVQRGGSGGKQVSVVHTCCTVLQCVAESHTLQHTATHECW